MSRIKLTYKGKVELVGNKVGHAYIDENGVKCIYKKQLIKSSIGSIVEVTKVNDTQITTPYEFKGVMDDTDLRDKWITEERMFTIQQQLKKKMVAVPTTKYDNLVDELSKIYRNLPYNQKTIFLIKLCEDVKN